MIEKPPYPPTTPAERQAVIDYVIGRLFEEDAERELQEHDLYGQAREDDYRRTLDIPYVIKNELYLDKDGKISPKLPKTTRRYLLHRAMVTARTLPDLQEPR